MTISKFPLSQPATCQTLRILWNNCKNNNVPIKAFKSQLTPEYCDQQILLINLAAALPDDAARTMVHAQIHEALVAAGKDCTNFWQALKIYINGVYSTKEERETQYRGASWADYEPAASENWSSVDSLMSGGSSYIANNLATLQGPNGDNIPDSFPAEFNASYNLFKSKWTAFTLSQEQASLGGAEKINKINQCYDNAILMCEVGQHVFVNNDELKKQFSFEAVGALVEPGSPSSFEITVIVNGVAKPGAEVSILNTDKSMVTDAQGKALFLQMSEGDIQCEVTCDGCAEKTVSATITASTRKRISVTLQPLFTGEFVVGSEAGSNQQQSGVSSQQATVNS